jgi:hypothetical protein
MRMRCLLTGYAQDDHLCAGLYHSTGRAFASILLDRCMPDTTWAEMSSTGEEGKTGYSYYEFEAC